MSINKLISKYQKDRLVYTGDRNISRIPSGIFVFDYLTDGGIPNYKITIFHGAKSSCKSTFSLIIAGKFLRQNKESNVIFVDFESSYYQGWADNFINQEDINRFFVIRPDYAEQGVDAMLEFMRENEVGLVIVDSLAAMNPLMEVEADAVTDVIGRRAKCISRFLFKAIMILMQRERDSTPLALVCINQVRPNFTSRIPGAVIKPGGIAQDFAASLDVKFGVKEYIKKGEEVQNLRIVFTLEKNKLGTPRRSGEIVMNIKDSIGYVDDDEIVVTYAKRSGVLDRDGSTWKFGENVFKTLSEVEEQVQNNHELKEKIKNAILKEKK